VLAGRVEHPGSFALKRDRTHAYTVCDLIKDSGGLLPDANPNGMVIYRRRDLSTDPAQVEDLNRILSATNREAAQPPVQVDQRGEQIQSPVQIAQSAQAGALGSTVAQSLSTLVSQNGTTIVLPPRPIRTDDMVTAIPVSGHKLLDSDGREGNIELEPGDNVVVPRLVNTVTVLGAVPRSGAVPFVATFRCRDYLKEAGGLREDAEERRMVVIHPNGAAAPIGLKGVIEPGDLIVVPTTYIVRNVRTENVWQNWLRSIIAIVTAGLVF